MARYSRHGWHHEPEPEHTLRTAATIIIIVLIIIAAAFLLGG